MSKNETAVAVPEVGEGYQPTTDVRVEMAVARQAQEVQVAMLAAKKFPRNTVEAYNKVLKACERRGLAEKALYTYTRGQGQNQTTITGPSIRLAEAIAQNWGNIDFGFYELEQTDEESQCMAFAWDLETNTRQTKMFTVSHMRHTKKGDYYVTDPRDIYEIVANNASRRVRSCILSIIPGDVVDGAVAQVYKTLNAGGSGKSLEDRVRSMAAAYKEQFGITLQQIEARIGRRCDTFTAADVAEMGNIFNSLKDGVAKKEEIFDMSITEPVLDALGAAGQTEMEG